MIEWLKKKFPEKASRKEGIRMVAIGVPVTIALAFGMSAILRWALGIFIGGR